MSNCNLNARSFIKNAVNANPIVFTNFVFDQNVISQDVNLLYVQVANSVLINNVTINALTVLNEKDVNSQIFRINQIVNNSPEDNSTLLTCSDVIVNNSSISFMSLGSISTSSSNQLLFTNMAFTNSYFTSQRAIMTTKNLEYTSDIQFKFQNLTFSNIDFLTVGQLFELKHQFPTALVISDSVFQNISSGYIQITSSNLQNKDLLTRLKFLNNTIDGIQLRAKSFLDLAEGAVAEIHDCTFSNIYSYFSGSAITAGFQKADVKVYNSVFINNTAIEGGIFNINSESILK